LLPAETTVPMASSRNVLYRCAACGLMKKRDHFHKTGTTLARRRHEMRCTACLVRCEGCGERRPLEDVDTLEDGAKMCAKCRDRRAVAKGNVFYRFPVLHYRSAPFPTETLRSDLLRKGDAAASYGEASKPKYERRGGRQ
jgi:hypothetical protein